MQSEADYQASLIRRIKRRFPGCSIKHSQPRDSGYVQGFPDLTIKYNGQKALLEVKKSATAKKQPNQQYYIDLYAKEMFTSFIYPENEDEVLDALQRSFASCGSPRHS